MSAEVYFQGRPDLEPEHMLSAKRLMRLLTLVGTLATASNAIGETPGNSVWSKFEKTRQGPRALHQEFEVLLRGNSGYAQEVSRYQVIVDFAQGRWREQAISGDELTRVFDGQELLEFESGGSEYTRTKKKGDKDESLPHPYETKVDWAKAKELQRLPCGFSGKDHVCVIVDVPVKPRVSSSRQPGHVTIMKDGTSRIMIDTETGVWLSCHTVTLVEGSNGGYQWDITYTIKKMSYSAPPNANLFKLPGTMKEVKELAPWNEARIRKQFVGKPAPDLQVTDIHGNRLSLGDLKGKTVLLDFWTTWCPPCQADASSIEKLNQKYGGKSLGIIGISVDEGRETVEKYLKRHPHNFPVVLSSENQLPRPYQIVVFPTYLIIGPDGTLMTAEEGEKGFGRLRKDLEKAGMEAE
jgi:thiol-disulfide isomerase/thioredoxin